MNPFDAETAPEPLEVFHRWMALAVETEENDPDAAALATATPNGVPSVRMVLVKRVDPTGFSFYTNAESRKGIELRENPRAALCFHWKTQRRQVRVEGIVRELSSEDADRYFHSRARRSQIGALASAQSRVLGSRLELESQARELEARFPGAIPRPDYWRGYVLQPERVEFWQAGADRLHDRVLFSRDAGGWAKVRLYP